MNFLGHLLGRCALAGALAFAPGIAAAKDAKPQDERPVLYLVTITSAGTSLHVVEIDGVRKYYPLKKRLRLDAGPHRIELQTGLMKIFNVRGADGIYQGRVRFSFEAKEGKSYVFSINPNSGGVSADSRVCIFEEPRDTGTRQSGFGEFRNPLAETEPLECGTLDLQRSDGG